MKHSQQRIKVDLSDVDYFETWEELRKAQVMKMFEEVLEANRIEQERLCRSLQWSQKVITFFKSLKQTFGGF